MHGVPVSFLASRLRLHSGGVENPNGRGDKEGEGEVSDGDLWRERKGGWGGFLCIFRAAAVRPV